MDVGIGLPNAVPGTTGKQLTEWARRADRAGFSSLGTIDRITYPNLEPLVALAAAAAVTERIKLATSILISPYRGNNALLAKQVASLQKISDGRVVLGIAVGGREADYEVSNADFEGRGKVFEEQLEELRSIWTNSGSASGTSDKEIGPNVAGKPPELVIGGSIDAAFRRAAEHGSGWIMGGGTPDMFAEGRSKLDAAWEKAGREGKPRGMALAYFALGDSGADDAQRYLGDYYAWLGEYAQQIADSAATDPETAKGYVQAFEAAGCDELIMFPSSSDPEQVDLLAAAVL